MAAKSAVFLVAFLLVRLGYFWFIFGLSKSYFKLAFLVEIDLVISDRLRSLKSYVSPMTTVPFSITFSGKTLRDCHENVLE